MAFVYDLTYCGIPFISDAATSFQMPGIGDTGQPPGNLPAPADQQALPDLIDELNRLIPDRYLQDVIGEDPPDFPFDALARRTPVAHRPPPDVRIGEWFYPTGASRWSVFRGLATSSMAKAMLSATLGKANPSTGLGGTFIMQAIPLPVPSPIPGALLSTMYLLPPRPMAEHGGRYDGLYLITLVDERYYWRRHKTSTTFNQGDGTSLTFNQSTTWTSVLSTLIASLGITLTIPPIPAPYGQPAPDSQLWATAAPVALLLDAVANTLGMVLVRSLSGAYTLATAPASYSQAKTNRGHARTVVRNAGGEIFASGRDLHVGDLTYAHNAVLPPSVTVTFPAYVYTDQSGGVGQLGPVPHFVNTRYRSQRDTGWYEDSYGGQYAITVPLLSGGLQGTPYNLPISGVLAAITLTQRGSGIVGSLAGQFHPSRLIRTTAKALYSGEGAPAPVNMSGLQAAAMQIAGDFYGWQAGGLDEVYPGTVPWTAEGGHDLVWTYSERQRQASTRVMRSPWGSYANEVQFSSLTGGTVSGAGIPETYVPPGMGGKSVAQTWRGGSLTASGSYSSIILSSGVGSVNTLGDGLASGDFFTFLDRIDGFPSYNRWKGTIDREVMLLDGVSGLGIPREATLSGQGYWITIAQRGIDGTIQTNHGPGTPLVQILPGNTYGVNLVSHEPGQFAYPQEVTSGGIAGIRLPPAVQTVVVLDGVGVSLPSGAGFPRYYSGRVQQFDPFQKSGFQFIPRDVSPSQPTSGANCWLIDRNYYALTSGRRYAGQLAGYIGMVAPFRVSGIGHANAPVYLVDHGILNVVCDPVSGLVVFQ